MRGKFIFILLVLCEAATLTAVFLLPPHCTIIGLTLVIAATVALYAVTLRYHMVIEDGMNLLRAQDYASRLRNVGQRDADSIVGIFNAMMDRIKEEHLSLQEKDYFLNQLIDASQQGIVIMSADEKEMQTNPAARAMLAEVAIPVLDDGESIVVRSARGGAFRVIRQSFMDKGMRRTFYIIEILTDELRKAEREAYGRIIRIISHEVNNTMGGVDSVLQIIRDTAGEDDLADVIESCRERGRNMTDFISKYATLVKLPDPDLISIDLAESVAPIRQFIDRMAAESGIDVEYEEKDSKKVKLDPVMWQQAVLNIVKNAIESILITGRTDGKITIDVRGATMQITDNGAGISDEVAKNLFTPFFTTKPGGQGIGLMLVREILTRHHCEFALLSENSSKKTHFRVKFLR